MKYIRILLFLVIYPFVIKAGNFDWFRLVQLSQRSHFSTGISTDLNRNVNVTGSYYPCLLCSKVGFLTSFDSLSSPRWSVSASTFGIMNIEFSRPFNDIAGNIYTSIYIPPYALNGPQLSVNGLWIGGPDSTGYAVIFSFTPSGNLNWYQVVPSSKPVVHCADDPGNSFLSNGDTTWKFNVDGVLSWVNTSKGGEYLSVGGADVYAGNGITIERLDATTGVYKASWTLPAYNDIEAGSGGVIFGTGGQGTFKVQNGTVLFQNLIVKGTGISRRGTELWVIEQFPVVTGIGGSVALRKLSTSTGVVQETQNINDVEPSGSRGNLAIDASGSVHVTFRGYDGAAYSYLKLPPFIVWRDYQNYEALFLAKYRTKYLTPVLGFTNSVWTNGEFGVDRWNESDIGAKKPCSGVNGFNVGYSLLNATLLSGNIVNVELSDSTGDFSNPVVIGSKLTTSSSGLVYCDLPFTLPNGPDYRLRLTTTAPAFTSIQESNPLGIYAPKSILLNNGPLSFCSGAGGTEILCLTDNPSFTILWQRNGVLDGNLLGPSVFPSKSGTYNTQVADNDGCVRRSDNNMAITVWPLPKAQLNLTGSNLICKDSTINFNVNAPTANSYQWFRNNVVLPGTNSSSLITSLAGLYKVTVTDVNGCTRTSNNGRVTIYKPAITAESPLTFCSGDSVILIGPVTNTTAYQWRKNSVDIPGATGINYTAKQSGNYTVVATSTLGCTAVSASRTVSVNCREGLAIASDWRAYPNPASGRLFVEWKDQQPEGVVELLDMSGRILLRAYLSANSTLHQMDISSFAPGMYRLRFTDQKGNTESRSVVIL